MTSDRAFAQISDRASYAACVDLCGVWRFRATDEAEWNEAGVPGSVYTDLLRAGRLNDPYYRDNELEAQWVPEKDWEYRRAFEVDDSLLACDRVVLECRGLDTIAQVYVNDAPVAETHNAFVEHEFDVKRFLKAGENSIRVVLSSVLEWCRQADARDPRVTWTDVLRSTRDKGYSAFLRKEACEFGWDWGIRLIRCGIWRPIRIVGYRVGRIADLAVRQDLSDPERATLHVAAEVELYGGEDVALELAVDLDGQEIDRARLPVHGREVRADLAVPDPQLWWPNGWGNHPLYTVRATLVDRGEVVHRRQARVGLRRVELVREADARGESFGFRINGHPIFCKGANWVPADALPERLTVDHYGHLLGSCVDVHMNMLRVWGGGRYEADAFYDYCDEHGLMIWHDFMFAEGPYLTTPEYLDNVRAEIASVVRRLRHHPSIVLWCGNNESEGSMTHGHRWMQFESVTWGEYDRVFGEAIPQTAARLDPDRPYWPSSPHHPLDRERRSPDRGTGSGDAHTWEVWHELRPPAAYEEMTGYRFVSEFGHQSLPTMATVRSFTAPEDRHLNSLAMEHHQKVWRDGTARIAYYVASLFRAPARLGDWVYLSQLVHGEAMRIGVEAFRRNWPDTTGALYWQLDNNWPAFSGCSIDYYGRWKAAHYMARRFFAPLLVSCRVDGSRVRIWGVNDRLDGTSLVLRWSLRRFDGREVRAGEQPVTLPPTSSTVIADLDLVTEVGEHPGYRTDRKESYRNRREHYLVCRLMQGDRQRSSQVVFFAPCKFLELPDPGLRYRIVKEPDRVSVVLTAERFAAYVELGLRNGYALFSDNYFCLEPGEERRIDVLDVQRPADGAPHRATSSGGAARGIERPDIRAMHGELSRRFYARSLVDTYR